MYKVFKAKWVFIMFNLDDESIEGRLDIDGRFSLIPLPPPNRGHLILEPLKTLQPTFEELVFYCDCLSFEHDSPIFMFPSRAQFLKSGYRFTCPEDRRFTYDWFKNDFIMALEGATKMRHGPFTFVNFRWPTYEEDLNISYSAKYFEVAKELHLYTTALKQLDFLSEFLCYYRVLESVCQNNAKNWIESKLEELKYFRFGTTTCSDEHGTRLLNLFSIYRRRALARLRQLRNRFLTDRGVTKYLYNENRCGIAHGKDDIKKYDWGEDFFTISKDNQVLKLLARMAIHEKQDRLCRIDRREERRLERVQQKYMQERLKGMFKSNEKIKKGMTPLIL